MRHQRLGENTHDIQVSYLYCLHCGFRLQPACLDGGADGRRQDEAEGGELTARKPRVRGEARRRVRAPRTLGRAPRGAATVAPVPVCGLDQSSQRRCYIERIKATWER